MQNLFWEHYPLLLKDWSFMQVKDYVFINVQLGLDYELIISQIVYK